MAGQHGFARNMPWSLMCRTASSATFVLRSNDLTKALWNHEFDLNYKVALTNSSLSTSLTVTNTGNSDSFDFTSLFHTYFAIGDIDQVKISGLQNLKYLDKLHNYEKFYEDRVEIAGINAEIDRNYLDCAGNVEIFCRDGKFSINTDFKDLGKEMSE